MYFEKNILQSDLNYAQIFYKYMMLKEPKWLILTCEKSTTIQN